MSGAGGRFAMNRMTISTTAAARPPTVANVSVDGRLDAFLPDDPARSRRCRSRSAVRRARRLAAPRSPVEVAGAPPEAWPAAGRDVPGEAAPDAAPDPAPGVGPDEALGGPEPADAGGLEAGRFDDGRRVRRDPGMRKPLAGARRQKTTRERQSGRSARPSTAARAGHSRPSIAGSAARLPVERGRKPPDRLIEHVGHVRVHEMPGAREDEQRAVSRRPEKRRLLASEQWVVGAVDDQ
jgi:hypothetical protein